MHAELFCSNFQKLKITRAVKTGVVFFEEFSSSLDDLHLRGQVGIYSVKRYIEVKVYEF